MTASSRRPTRIERAWQRAPLLLYRLGLGPLLGQRLRLTHTGRRTGLRHHTILEIMEHQSGSREYLVGALWGPDSDWLRNVQADGAVEVLIGRRTFSASARIVNPPEAGAVLERYRQRRPRWSALAERVIGHPLTAETVRVVAFKPNEARFSMSAAERVGRFGDRVFDRLRHRAAFTITDGNSVGGDLYPLADSKYAVVVTFKRDGTAVPSPVWIAVDAAGTAYVKTANHSGKVKRLRNDSRVLVAPSTMRGKPTGPAIRATGRVLPEDEWMHAEETLAAAYGPGRRIAERLLGGDAQSDAYITITPGSGGI